MDTKSSVNSQNLTEINNEEPSNKSLPACRLWIGNLDSKLRDNIVSNINLLFSFYHNWFNLLKMVEKFGPLAEFDFLYHRSGPQNGQPKGYAFVTYQTIEHAIKAQRTMDGLEVLGRTLAVKWAHARDETKYVGKTKPAPPILSISTKEATASDKVKKMSKESKIAALEAQLKVLEEKSGEMSFTPDIGGPSKPTSVIYNYIEPRPKMGGSFGKISYSHKHTHSSNNPYHHKKMQRK